MDRLVIALAKHIINTEPYASHLKVDDFLKCAPEDVEKLFQIDVDDSQSVVYVYLNEYDNKSYSYLNVQVLSNKSTTINRLQRLKIESFVTQSFSLDFILYIAGVRSDDLINNDFSSRKDIARYQLSDDNVKYLIQNSIDKLKIPYALTKITFELLHYHTNVSKNDKVLSVPYIILVWQNIYDTEIDLIIKYKFFKLLVSLIREILNTTQSVSLHIDGKATKLIESCTKLYSFDEVALDEPSYYIIYYLMNSSRYDVKELIEYLVLLDLHYCPLPESLFSASVYSILSLSLYDYISLKMTTTESSLNRMNYVISLLSQTFTISRNDILCVFVIQYYQTYSSIGQIREPEVLQYLIDNTQINEQQLTNLQKLCDPIILNYVLEYYKGYDSFKAGINLVSQLRRVNIDIIIEYLIINSVNYQIAQFKYHFAEKISYSENLYKFDKYLSVMESDVKYQIEVFIPALCYLYEKKRFINRDVTIGYYQAVVNLKVYEFILGGTSEVCSHVPRHLYADIYATPLTVYAIKCYSMLYDVISCFEVIMSYTQVKGRISMRDFVLCLAKLENIMKMLFAAIYKYVLSDSSNQDQEKATERLNTLYPNDLVIYVVAPLMNYALDTEISHFKQRVLNALLLGNRQSSYDPYCLDEGKRDYTKLVCYQVADEITYYCNDMTTNYFSRLCLTEVPVQKILYTLEDLTNYICDSISVHNQYISCLPPITSVFYCDTVKASKAKEFQYDYYSGLSSAALCASLQDNRFCLQAMYHLETYFAEYDGEKDVPINAIPKTFNEVIRAIKYVRMNINTIDAVYKVVQRIYLSVSRAYYAKNSLILITAPGIVARDQSPIFDQIYLGMAAVYQQLTRHLASFAIFTGLRSVFQSTYCPAPAFSGISALVDNLRIVVREATEFVAPSQQEQISFLLAQAVFQAYRYILLDSGVKSRQITESDHKQLYKDVFSIQQCFYPYNSEQALMGGAKLTEVVQPVLRLLVNFSKSSSLLTEEVGGLADGALAEIDSEKDISSVQFGEEKVRVLAHRRGEEPVARFLKGLRKALAK